MKKISEILIATHNKGKFEEISSLLSEINIKAISPFEFNFIEPEENGSTFEENSQIKAKFYGNKTGLVSLADDSGICIEALNGAPGIDSAPFAVDETGKRNFLYAFEKIFKNKEKINQNPNAYFICNLSLFIPKEFFLESNISNQNNDSKNEFIISFEGRIDGKLTYPPKGEKGFGYDPIFIKNGMNKTFGEIDANEKDKASHRGNAFEKLINWLKKNNL
jgi:XTP/dITP diphosphohydrolase